MDLYVILIISIGMAYFLFLRRDYKLIAVSVLSIFGKHKWKPYPGNEEHALPHLKKYRRSLRNNATETERRLWHYLRKRRLDGRKFRRQHSVGNYILDFYCPMEKIGVEVDGKYHFTPWQQEYDYRRDAYLESKGIRVLRFENHLVWEQAENVLEEIKRNFGWTDSNSNEDHPQIEPQ